MTNEQIIFTEASELMKQGVLASTARILMKVLDKDGNEVEKWVDIPEDIHTYNGWKELGYQVQKGEKAIASFCIWKFVGKKNDEDEDKMFLKKSAFFKKSQVKEVAQ